MALQQSLCWSMPKRISFFEQLFKTAIQGWLIKFSFFCAFVHSTHRCVLSYIYRFSQIKSQPHFRFFQFPQIGTHNKLFLIGLSQAKCALKRKFSKYQKKTQWVWNQIEVSFSQSFKRRIPTKHPSRQWTIMKKIRNAGMRRKEEKPRHKKSKGVLLRRTRKGSGVGERRSGVVNSIKGTPSRLTKLQSGPKHRNVPNLILWFNWLSGVKQVVRRSTRMQDQVY